MLKILLAGWSTILERMLTFGAMGDIRSVYLGLGSNLGDRNKNLARARQGLQANFGPPLATSSIYETAAWGNEDQPGFLNQIIAFRTYKSPGEILNRILILEKKMGRIRDQRWGPRLIDIDLLFCGALIFKEPGLTVPHPEIANRKFVLEPMVEIAADFMHPVLNLDMSTLLEKCQDHQKVQSI